MTDFRPIFVRLGLQKYIQSFAEEGFETWETIGDITESDLDALKVKLGHRRILQREIAAARGIRLEQLDFLNSASHASTSREQRYDRTNEVDEEPGAAVGPRAKRRYRRHPKSDDNAPERPPSAYVIFSNRIRDELKPLNLSFADIAKRVGESWQVLSPEEKEPYESQASAAKERFHKEMAAYKLTDLYREYQRYLADFKAKHPNSSGRALQTSDNSSADPLSLRQRPRLPTDPSSTSSASMGSGPEAFEASPTSLDDRARRFDPASAMGPYPASASSPSPSSASSKSVLSHPGRPSMFAAPTGAPMPASPSSPSTYMDLSHGPPRSSQEYHANQMAFPNAGSRLSRVLRTDPPSSSTGSSTIGSVDQGLSQVSKAPPGGISRVPRFVHETSDSSKSSSTSNPSAASTGASSLYSNKTPEDDAKHVVVLPPLASVPRNPSATTSIADHALRPNQINRLGVNAGMAAPPISSSSRAPSLVSPDAIGDRGLGNLHIQPSLDEMNTGAQEFSQLPGIRQLPSGDIPSSGILPDPLLVLADAAHQTNLPGPDTKRGYQHDADRK